MGDTLEYIQSECEEWAEMLSFLLRQGNSKEEALDLIDEPPLSECWEFVIWPDQDAIPSEVMDKYWLSTSRKIGEYPRPTSRNGKWLIFIDKNDIDEVWIRIKKSTEEGKLGSGAKVSTSRPNPNSTNPDTGVICVYTYDWSDERDVKRVREELRKIGITNKISYKSDEDTLLGKYRVKGDRRISKYYE